MISFMAVGFRWKFVIARLDCLAASCTSDCAKKAPHGSVLTIALQTGWTDLQWWIFAAKKVRGRQAGDRD